MPVEKPMDQAAPATPPKRRRYFGADGRAWTVWEMPPPAFDRRRGPTLVFETEELMRRVRNYPTNWFECSDEELMALSQRI